MPEHDVTSSPAVFCMPQAQKHRAQLYRQVPPSVLEWSGRDGRGERLLAEIGRHLPDVLTLQEVDHMSGFQTGLARLGWAWVSSTTPASEIDSGNLDPIVYDYFGLYIHDDASFRQRPARRNWKKSNFIIAPSTDLPVAKPKESR